MYSARDWIFEICRTGHHGSVDGSAILQADANMPANHGRTEAREIDAARSGSKVEWPGGEKCAGIFRGLCPARLGTVFG